MSTEMIPFNHNGMSLANSAADALLRADPVNVGIVCVGGLIALGGMSVVMYKAVKAGYSLEYSDGTHTLSFHP